MPWCRSPRISRAGVRQRLSERAAGGGGEQRLVGLSFAFVCPDAQDGDGLLSERRDALFSALCCAGNYVALKVCPVA